MHNLELCYVFKFLLERLGKVTCAEKRRLRSSIAILGSRSHVVLKVDSFTVEYASNKMREYDNRESYDKAWGGEEDSLELVHQALRICTRALGLERVLKLSYSLATHYRVRIM